MKLALEPTISSELAARYFTVPLREISSQDGRPTGIFMPEPEIGVARTGITEQFLSNAGEYHTKYSNEGHFAGLFREAFASLGGAPTVQTVLDIGTGSGVNTIGPLLAQLPGCTVVATDLSPDLLRILRSFVEAEALEDRVACVCTDAMRNHFRPEMFDLVVGAAILHHLIDPVDALRAAYRALKPGGTALWFEPFEPGIRILRMAYKLILKQHEQGRPLDERVVAALRALILDADTRAGTDKSAEHFLHMDDKWLFTRSYIERAARTAGFESVELLPHAAHKSLFRDIMRIEMQLVAAIPPEAVPDWAWDFVDMTDACFTDDAKRDMPHEATILLHKAA